MPGEPETNSQPQKAMLSDAVDLSKRFGGLDRVPDEELSKIGFRKIGDNIAPLEGYIIDEPEGKKPKEPESLEEKTKNAPFGEITVNLSGKEIPFRRLSEWQIKVLYKRFESIDEFFDNRDEYDYVPQNSPLHALIK